MSEQKKRKILLSFLFVYNNFTLSEFFRIFVFWANLEDEWNTCYTLSGFKGWIEYMLYFVWTYCLIFHNFCPLDKYYISMQRFCLNNKTYKKCCDYFYKLTIFYFGIKYIDSLCWLIEDKCNFCYIICGGFKICLLDRYYI